MIRFRFELCPLDEVSAWGGEEPRLHWFGLTEGWYRIEADGRQLLRRTRLEHPHPYVDYYVVRLWEDLNLLTPDVLEPVPADLQGFIASDRAEWACDPLDFIPDDAGPDTPDHPVMTAAIWHGDHYLDLGYLRNAPRLRCWRTVHDGLDEITVDWRHEDDGEIGFTAGPAVRFRVPTDEYLEAVRRLDRDLMTAMRQRIEDLERRGGLPGVNLDLAALRREHEDRSLWLARNLARSLVTDWQTVRAGARRLLGAADSTSSR